MKATKIPKKRGRKPKGGKIVTVTPEPSMNKIIEPNIILHLKCNLKDLVSNNSNVRGKINSYNFDKDKKNDFEEIPDIQSVKKTIREKLVELSINLQTNNISDKKSACFWCTYDFDNHPVYIPLCEQNQTYHSYGCFCSPECATAFLFKEDIDTSTRFERYSLLNHVYCKVYDYKQNIKPAPNPYYTLERYFGNLTIQEYRKGFPNERLLLVIDKPLSRIMPGLHDDNSSFEINNTTIPSANSYRNTCSHNSENKSNIIAQQFNKVITAIK